MRCVGETGANKIGGEVEAVTITFMGDNKWRGESEAAA